MTLVTLEIVRSTGASVATKYAGAGIDNLAVEAYEAWPAAAKEVHTVLA